MTPLGYALGVSATLAAIGLLVCLIAMVADLDWLMPFGGFPLWGGIAGCVVVGAILLWKAALAGGPTPTVRTVTGKNEHSTTTYVQSGKVLMPITTTHRYLYAERARCSVGSEGYGVTQVGQRVSCQWTDYDGAEPAR